MEIAECQLMCGFQSERFTVPNHMLESCPRSLEACPHCTQAVRKSDMDEHVAKCIEEMSSCDECRKNVPRENMDVHLKEYCSKRDKECTFCGTSIVANTMHEHYKVCELLEIQQPQCSKVMNSRSDISLAEKYVIREVQCVFCDSFVQETSLAKLYDTCESALVRCGNKCGVKILRKDISEHYRNECPKALVPCEHCEKKVKRQLLEDHHAECVKFPIPCPESCGVEVTREDVERHLDEECQKRFAACAYKDMQCSYEGFPAGMMQHMKEEMQHHMDLLKGIATNLHFKLENEKQINQDVKGKMENLQLELESKKKRNQEVEVIVLYLKLQFESEKKVNEEVKGMVENLRLKLESERKRNEELKMEINTLRHGSFLWKVKDVAAEIERGKRDGDIGITSPPFYSSKHGYKLNVSITPYENRSEYKGHLGVYIQLMPGEYDSILKWPFTKLVKFRLVNQATDGEDIVKCLRGEDVENFLKPKDGRCNTGRGFSTFVSHKVLSSRSYIVDNAMFLEVSVEE